MHMRGDGFTRRAFLAGAAGAAGALAYGAASSIPVGLEMFSVRNELKTDPMGTVRAVAKMGYQDVEFFAPYFDWTPDYAKQVRQVLEARVAGQLVQGAAADDQMPGLAVHLREHGVRGDDVFQTVRHGRSPNPACWGLKMPTNCHRQS